MIIFKIHKNEIIKVPVKIEFNGYKCVTIVEKHSVNHDRRFIVEQCHSEQLKKSSFLCVCVKTIIEWNHLVEAVVHTETA